MAHVSSAKAEELRDALSASACRIEPVKAKGEGHKWSATAECSVDEQPKDDEVPITPCTTNISLAVAHDIAKDHGFNTQTELARLLREDVDYEPAEAMSVLTKWTEEVRALPAPTDAETDWADTFEEIFALPSNKMGVTR